MNRLLDKKFASSPFIVKLGTKKKERKKTQIGTNKNNGLIVANVLELCLVRFETLVNRMFK
jgi:hypothetical protein